MDQLHGEADEEKEGKIDNDVLAVGVEQRICEVAPNFVMLCPANSLILKKHKKLI